jgi:hypothetical protein
MRFKLFLQLLQLCAQGMRACVGIGMRWMCVNSKTFASSKNKKASVNAVSHIACKSVCARLSVCNVCACVCVCGYEWLMKKCVCVCKVCVCV